MHSGQASGGHYYSYIQSGGTWWKFDDGEVTEVNMADDEELKNQVQMLLLNSPWKVRIGVGLT